MNKILDFIEDHKYGIIVALFVHVGVFIYFQVKTYKEIVVYEPWSFRTKDTQSPDDIELSLDQIETIEEAMLYDQEELITSFVKSENDSREEELQKDKQYTSFDGERNRGGDPYSDIKEFESDVIQQLKEKRAERDGEKSFSEQHDTDLESSQLSENEKEQENKKNTASDKAVAGETMVSYDLKNRHPLNHNDWHVRNPGYTCGNVNGLVVVQIRVAPNGDVTHAKYIPNRSMNADNCMIRQAEKYALMSRFNVENEKHGSQEGTITYHFVYRR